MRKMILLAAAFSLSLAAVSFSPRAQADDSYPCPQCTTYPDGSQCCVSCTCFSSGRFTISMCAENACAPID